MIEEISFDEMVQNKNEIISLLRSTERAGIEELIKFLEESGFFTDPASISGYGNKKYHGSFKGGLSLHSLSVYRELKKYKDAGLYTDIDDSSIIICALLHDLCKVGTYCIENKNVKDEKGQWTSVEIYSSNPDVSFVYGHGEKSVIMIEEFIKLSNLERMAIRFHMGAYEGESAWNYVEQAFRLNPFIFFIHVADDYSAKFVA